METETETIPVKVKKFVIRHKTGLAVFATAGICLALNRLALRDHDNFLAEKGLLDEYYSPED